jgi:hypothetical protein
MFAHAHIAAVGWATMMVVGLSYRLIPMILPAAMPAGRQLALSAVLIEGGLVVLVVALLAAPAIVPAGALLLVGGLGAFVSQIRTIVKRRLPRPPALPLRDWSTWQTHVAFLWLLVAAGLGVTLSFGAGGESTLTLMWVYGVAGLVGFLAQIVTGMQGRLVPFYAWYRAFDARNGPPDVAANALPTPRFARPVFVLWTVGVPLLAVGLPSGSELAIRFAAVCLLGGVALGMTYIVHMLRTAAQPQGSDLES